MTKKKIHIYIFLLVMAVLAAPAESMQEIVLQEHLSLFDTDEVIEMTITTDLKTLRKDIKDERSYHPARLSYMDSQNREISINVHAKTRGHSRRKPHVCDFPPLTLKFTKSENNHTVFRKQKKLKLVTHCRKRIKDFKRYVMLEYLAYRLYNILTDKSFRVRLAHVTYADSKGKSKPYTKYAFLIENDKQMAKRLNGKIIENAGGFRILHRLKNLVLHDVFQFMIGNTDYSATHGHNVEQVASNSDNSVFPVPYDFDLSGIVETHYAKPDSKLKIESVRDRLYRGFCIRNDKLPVVFQHFNKSKEKIYALYRDFPLLTSRAKKRTIRYIEKFYKIINTPRLVKKYFIENCL